MRAGVVEDAQAQRPRGLAGFIATAVTERFERSQRPSAPPDIIAQPTHSQIAGDVLALERQPSMAKPSSYASS